jgi:hypothetical protein
MGKLSLKQGVPDFKVIRINGGATATEFSEDITAESAIACYGTATQMYPNATVAKPLS